jgi:hypothetical protein
MQKMVQKSDSMVGGNVSLRSEEALILLQQNLLLTITAMINQRG